MEHLNDNETHEEHIVVAEVYMRHKRHRQIALSDVAVLYGQRPHHDDVWIASPYDFVAAGEVFMLSY